MKFETTLILGLLETLRTGAAAFGIKSSASERVMGVPPSDVGGRLLYNRLISTQALDWLVC